MHGTHMDASWHTYERAKTHDDETEWVKTHCNVLQRSSLTEAYRRHGKAPHAHAQNKKHTYKHLHTHTHTHTQIHMHTYAHTGTDMIKNRNRSPQIDKQHIYYLSLSLTHKDIDRHTLRGNGTEYHTSRLNIYIHTYTCIYTHADRERERETY